MAGTGVVGRLGLHIHSKNKGSKTGVVGEKEGRMPECLGIGSKRTCLALRSQGVGKGTHTCPSCPCGKAGSIGQ